MLLTLYLLFNVLHDAEVCTLKNNTMTWHITAYTGESVLLPCSCNDLHTKPENLTWNKYNTNTSTYEEISSESDQYRNRVQLFNDHSPANLSLLISHLTEEDGGDYRCAVTQSEYIYVSVIVKGCSVEHNGKVQKITAHTGESVLLPCNCTDPNAKPETFSWKKHNTNRNTWEEISSEGGQYRNRVQLFNDHSPANLSLLISHLTEEDGGVYRCHLSVTEYTDITLIVKGNMQLYIFIPVLLLLLGIGGGIYWKYRGWRRGQIKSAEQEERNTGQKTQDEVTYSTVVPTNTTRMPTMINTEDKTEYASVRVN